MIFDEILHASKYVNRILLLMEIILRIRATTLSLSREGQEEQLGALGLVVNAIIVWNTRYIESALQVLRNRGHTIDNDDISRLSPLGHKHINIVGRYSFVLPEEVKDGQLRTLTYEETNKKEPDSL
jgi:hypothetical protein